MSTLNREIYEAFQATGIDDAKAKAAAASVYEKEQIATKLDIADLRTDLKTQIASMDGKLTLLIGLNIAMAVTAFGPYLVKLFGR